MSYVIDHRQFRHLFYISDFTFLLQRLSKSPSVSQFASANFERCVEQLSIMANEGKPEIQNVRQTAPQAQPVAPGPVTDRQLPVRHKVTDTSDAMDVEPSINISVIQPPPSTTVTSSTPVVQQQQQQPVGKDMDATQVLNRIARLRAELANK